MKRGKVVDILLIDQNNKSQKRYSPQSDAQHAKRILHTPKKKEETVLPLNLDFKENKNEGIIPLCHTRKIKKERSNPSNHRTRAAPSPSPTQIHKSNNFPRRKTNKQENRTKTNAHRRQLLLTIISTRLIIAISI